MFIVLVQKLENLVSESLDTVWLSHVSHGLRGSDDLKENPLSVVTNYDIRTVRKSLIIYQLDSFAFRKNITFSEEFMIDAGPGETLAQSDQHSFLEWVKISVVFRISRRSHVWVTGQMAKNLIIFNIGPFILFF